MRAVSKVYAVDGVELSLVRGATITLVVAARGRTASSGWGAAQLSPYVYVTPPADGIQDCDFLAETPSSGSAVARVLSPILAEHTLDGIDIEGYWGPGRALKGVRVHAVANAKLAMLADAPHMAGARNFSADATDYAPTTPVGPSYATDIRPLFRPTDVTCMLAVSGFNLHDYDDAKSNAQGILGRLSSGSMPMDGPWPAADVALFESWVTTGMAP